MALNWQQQRQAALDDVNPFIDLIYSGLDGMLAIVTKDENGKLNSERWFSADQLSSVSQYCAARWDEDVYFSVSTFPPSPVKPGTSSRVSTPQSRTNIVYADADECDPKNFRLTPSVILETSPGRWHCMWVLDEPRSGTDVAELSAKVSTAHAEQGCDKHARDTKILRIPGTTNTKYTKNHRVVAEYTGCVYTYEEFAAAYEDISLSAATVPARLGSDFAEKVYTPDQLESLKRYADAVWDRAKGDLDREAAKGWQGDGWDNVAYRVACMLVRTVNAPWAGRTLTEAALHMDSSDLNDASFQASGKLSRAVQDVNGESLRLPDWAEPYQGLKLPEPDETTRETLEERIDRAGFTQWYVSVPQDADVDTFISDLIRNAREAGFNDTETYSTVVWSSVFRNKAEGLSTTKEAVWLYLTGSEELEVIDSIPLPRGGTSWHKIPALLSEAERAWCVSNPAFPDEYTEWVSSTGTDAATVYQRSLSFMVLSAVYADIGYLRDPFGDSRLNLYCMVLGDSTLTRKTTAINRMMTVIHEYEERSGRVIDLASNATTEALNKALANANGETRVMWTDEIQGFLDEIGTKKYLSGFLGMLAKLYDGKVDATLRVSQGSGNARAEVAFNFIGVGIRAHVADTLTTRNYESGLMPRFVWAVADPPPFTEHAMELSEAEERDDGFDKYESVVAMCNRFIRARRTLDEAAFKPILLSKDALDRYNEFGRVVSRYIKDSGQHEYLSAALLRFGMSVRKAAALLAMHDGQRTVSMEHMLHAIRQGEFWLRDMIRMANEVAASDFDRDVDLMEQYIMEGKNNQRSYADIRNKFRSMRYMDFNECLGNLTARGRVKYDKEREIATAFVI